MNAMELMEAHRAHDRAEAFVVGVVRRGIVYRASVAEIPAAWTRESRESTKKGGGLTIRLYIPAKTADDLIRHNVFVPLCEAARLNRKGMNKGEAFEAILTEERGQTWKKDHVPFTVAGDITIDGKQIQIKLQGATLASETIMRKLGLVEG